MIFGEKNSLEVFSNVLSESTIVNDTMKNITFAKRHNQVSFSDMDQIESTFNNYRGLSKFKELSSWTDLILKHFLMFILLSEMAAEYFKKLILINQAHALHRLQKCNVSKLLLILFYTHLFLDALMFILSSIFIVVSDSFYDAISNALALLIILYLHSMGSKFFLMELSVEFSWLTLEPDYL